MSDEADGGTVDLWSLAEDVVVEPGAQEGELVLTGRWGTERVSFSHPVVEEALRRMELGPVLLANLEAKSAESAEGGDGGGGDGRADTDGADGADDHDERACLLVQLERLSHLIVRTLGVDDLGGPLLSAAPLFPLARFSLTPLPGRRPVRLPSGASLTVGRGGVTVQAPDSSYRVLVHRPEAAWVLARLAWPVTPDQMAAALALPVGVTKRIMDYLAAAGMAAEAADDERVPPPVLSGGGGGGGRAVLRASDEPG
ncbi:NADH oxidase [Streptomyces sp. NPDC088785]|uniref:NADH oxidase n=1 Tax=Streptomyces sp. NPDC088785 TaxID=3365897 RepID=UPI00382AA0F6